MEGLKWDEREWECREGRDRDAENFHVQGGIHMSGCRKWYWHLQYILGYRMGLMDLSITFQWSNKTQTDPQAKGSSEETTV